MQMQFGGRILKTFCLKIIDRYGNKSYNYDLATI